MTIENPESLKAEAPAGAGPIPEEIPETPGADAGPQPAPDPVAILADLPTEKLVDGILEPFFGTVCPGWEITDQERGWLAKSYAAVIDKYFPDGIRSPELAALAVTVIVFAPRRGRPRAKSKIINATREAPGSYAVDASKAAEFSGQ